MADPKASPKCVSLKSDVKKLFDKALKSDVLDQVEKTVKTIVEKNKSKGLEFDNNCKDGWMLQVTVDSLTVDDADQPTTMEVEISIDGVALNGVAKAFKLSGKAKAKGLRGKKLKQIATLIVGDAIEDPMTNKAIPHMLAS